MSWIYIDKVDKPQDLDTGGSTVRRQRLLGGGSGTSVIEYACRTMWPSCETLPLLLVAPAVERGWFPMPWFAGGICNVETMGRFHWRWKSNKLQKKLSGEHRHHFGTSNDMFQGIINFSLRLEISKNNNKISVLKAAISLSASNPMSGDHASVLVSSLTKLKKRNAHFHPVRRQLLSKAKTMLLVHRPN